MAMMKNILGKSLVSMPMQEHVLKLHIPTGKQLFPTLLRF